MAKGQTVTPGSAYVQCPHRSELAGILAGLCYIIDICATFGVTHGSITLGCDGLGALDAIKKTHNSKYTIKNNRKHFDILTAIKQLTRCIPDIYIKFVHVKGHQDDEKEFGQLDRLGQLNVLTDAIAGDMMKMQRSLGFPRTDFIPCEPLYVDKVYVNVGNATYQLFYCCQYIEVISVIFNGIFGIMCLLYSI